MKRIARYIKRLFKVAAGRDIIIRPDIKCDRRRIGSVYGGWVIAPEYIDKDSIVYSFGIGEDASFDIEMIQRYGVTVNAFDPSPRSIEWVHRQKFPREFLFREFGLADIDGTLTLCKPKDPKLNSLTIVKDDSIEESGCVLPVKKLLSIMMLLGHQRIDLLKMDIEGAEYQVLDDMVISGVRPTQLILEFHHMFRGVGIQKTKDAIKTIRGMGYRLFSVSSSGYEYSFLYNEGQ